MSDVNHTPGPWIVQRYNDLQYSLSKNEGYEEGQIADEEDEANAKLIAAAPDMLQALIEAKKCLLAEGYGPLDTSYARIINAINKATR